MSVDNRPVGFGLYKRIETARGLLVSIEGRAIHQDFQKRRLGSIALRELLVSEPEIVAAASCTRNPAIPRLMNRYFDKVSPDISHTHPLHLYEDDEDIRYFTEVYGTHVGAAPEDLPFTYGRYKGGLYGSNDPGVNFPGIPEIQTNGENGIIMVATERNI